MDSTISQSKTETAGTVGARRSMVRSLTQFLVHHPFKGSVRLQFSLAKHLLRAPSGPTIAQTLYGFDMHVNLQFDWGLEEALYYCGVYEPGTLWVIDQCLSRGHCFIDVGANIGLMTVYAARAVGGEGTVLAFEPDPDTFSILQSNVGLNELDNVISAPVALGKSAASLPLYRMAHNRGRSSLVAPDAEGTRNARAQVQPLDSFLAEHGVPTPRMVKIDVEGWELDVLQGAEGLLGGPDAPILCVEYNRNVTQDNQALLDVYRYVLTVNDYSIFKLAHGKESISKLVAVSRAAQLPYHDNLFCFLTSHLSELPRSLFAGQVGKE